MNTPANAEKALIVRLRMQGYPLFKAEKIARELLDTLKAVEKLNNRLENMLKYIRDPVGVSK